MIISQSDTIFVALYNTACKSATFSVCVYIAVFTEYYNFCITLIKWYNFCITLQRTPHKVIQ